MLLFVGIVSDNYPECHPVLFLGDGYSYIVLLMSQMHPGNLLGRDSRQLDAWEEEINAALSKLPQHALQSFWNLAVPCLLCDSGVCHRLAYLANTLAGRYLPNNTDHTTRPCVSQ